MGFVFLCFPLRRDCKALHSLVLASLRSRSHSSPPSHFAHPSHTFLRVGGEEEGEEGSVVGVVLVVSNVTVPGTVTLARRVFVVEGDEVDEAEQGDDAEQRPDEQEVDADVVAG